MKHVIRNDQVSLRRTPRKPRLVSLFSGAGGIDYGFESAGFETAAALELDPDCCATLRANRNWPVLEGNIFDISSRQITEAAGVRKGELDVLIGGPPCQPFSKAGYWATGDAKRLDDPRADTLSAYLRVVRDTLPKAFLLENVEGIAYSGKNEGLNLLLEMIDALNRQARTNYRVKTGVVCAADFGVPQVRNRFILVAVRDNGTFDFPVPTHSETPVAGLRPYSTCWDAIGDLDDLDHVGLQMTGKWADLLPSIPEGENYLWHTERGGGLPLFGWRRRYWNFLLKLARDKPSWTIQAQPGPATGPFHWKNRRLSMRELCRLQTFPDSVRIQGPYRSIHRQLGNAVPSLLAEVFAREIKRQVFGLPVSRTPKLLPTPLQPIPSPRALPRVPRKYREMIGEHEPHPGTGLGYRSLKSKAT